MNDRRLSPSGTQPAAPPVKAQIYTSEWLRQQPQAAVEEPGDAVAAAEAQPAAPQAPDPEPPPPLHRNLDRNFDRNFDPNQPSLANPFIPATAEPGSRRDRLASSMPFWTQPAPPGCPFPSKKAPLRGAAEVDKKPNFIEFYEISRLTWRCSVLNCTDGKPRDGTGRLPIIEQRKPHL